MRSKRTKRIFPLGRRKKNHIEKEIGEEDLMAEVVGGSEEVIHEIRMLIEEGGSKKGRSLLGWSFHSLKFLRQL